MLAVGREREVVDAAAVDADRPAIEAVSVHAQIQKALVAPRGHAPRVAGRARVDAVRVRASAPVNDVTHPAPRAEALVVVVVAGESEPDVVALEERHPAPHDLRMQPVPAARVRGVVERGNPPARGGGPEPTSEPGGLRVVDRVRVEHEDLDVTDAAAVVAARHLERRELVPAAFDTDIVVSE